MDGLFAVLYAGFLFKFLFSRIDMNSLCSLVLKGFRFVKKSKPSQRIKRTKGGLLFIPVAAGALIKFYGSIKF